ncbi:hypothetical protein C2E23DRAFT_880617 [Lenzites betulinus]|nr:hypothetical protein C2E23DRAFT_880617 [Lenzites betulinus]
MLSFAATVNVVLLIFTVAAFYAPRPVAGAPTNTTLGLNSTLVAFTPGWRAATFAEDGSLFAFADALNEEVRITLPQNITAVYYEGFRVAGGGLYLACLDCVFNVTVGQLVGANASVIDAHDSRENGTQPPDTLFSFIGLDPTINHTLTVVNLEDPLFNNTSQITFDSVVVTTDPQESGNATTSSSIVLVPNLPTLTVTAIEANATTTGAATTSPTIANGPIATNAGTGTGATSAGLPGATAVPTAATTTAATANTSNPAQNTPAPGTTSVAGTGGAGQGTTTVQSTGAAATGTQTAGNTQPGQTGTGAGTATGTAGAGTQTGTAGAGTQTGVATLPATGTDPNGTSQPTGTNGASQATGTNPAGAPTTAAGGNGSPTASGDITTLPSVSVILMNTNAYPSATGTTPGTANGAANTGVSKQVIIAIAVVASLLVLSLLGAVLFVLVRSRRAAARRPQAADTEGAADAGAGTGRLVQAAAPPAMVYVPQNFAPSRPTNPFADTVSADIPIDAPYMSESSYGSVFEPEPEPGYEPEYEPAEVLTAPQPRPPPPPIPPKSPLRGSFSKPAPWLNRVPRNSSGSPTSSTGSRPGPS